MKKITCIPILDILHSFNKIEDSRRENVKNQEIEQEKEEDDKNIHEFEQDKVEEEEIQL